MENISNTLKNLRQVNNKTQNDIARQMGIGRTTYTKIENDPANATLSEMQQLANIHGVDLTIILGINDSDRYYKALVQIKLIMDRL